MSDVDDRSEAPADRNASCPIDSDGSDRTGHAVRRHGADGRRPDPHVAPVRVELVESPDPVVVLASLAAQCAPAWCDRCTVDLVVGRARQRITEPPEPPEPLETARLSPATPHEGARLHVPFDLDTADAFGSSRPADAEGPVGGRVDLEDRRAREQFRGVVCFSWKVSCASPGTGTIPHRTTR